MTRLQKSFRTTGILMTGIGALFLILGGLAFLSETTTGPTGELRWLATSILLLMAGILALLRYKKLAGMQICFTIGIITFVSVITNVIIDVSTGQSGIWFLLFPGLPLLYVIESHKLKTMKSFPEPGDGR
jgi:peptidoglycan/LPS O-acetylase OafA/YrhL